MFFLKKPIFTLPVQSSNYLGLECYRVGGSSLSLENSSIQIMTKISNNIDCVAKL